MPAAFVCVEHGTNLQCSKVIAGPEGSANDRRDGFCCAADKPLQTSTVRSGEVGSSNAGGLRKRSIPDGIDLLELLGRFELPDARRCAASIRCGLKMRLRRRRSAVQIPGNYKKDLSRMG